MTSDDKALNAARWIVQKSIEGIPPLTGCEQLAHEYLLDKEYPTNDDRVSSLINWETSKNFTTGFVTGLGGLLTLPIAVPSALAAGWVLQARMSGAIACIYGHSMKEDRVQTLVLLALLGNSAKEVLKQAGIKIGQKVTAKVIEKIPGRVLIEINQKVGFRLLTKAGEKGVINLSKAVPVVGGIVGGGFDAYSCRVVGRVAREIFRNHA
jgi:hypothetical protein